MPSVDIQGDERDNVGVHGPVDDSSRPSTAASASPPPNAEMLTVIIPAFNEEEGLPPTLKSLQAETRLTGCRIIVVDDGSTDGTVAAARAVPGVEVLQHLNNKGYGAGIKTGTRHASTQYVAWFDADGQHRAEDLARLFEAAVNNDYDAVFGNRASGSAVVKSRVAGKKVLGFVANSVANQKIPDINCGLRVFRRAVLTSYLPLLPDGFSASTTTTLLCIKRNRHHAFLPIVTAERVGKSTVKQVRDGVRTLHLMMRILFLFSAFRTFALASGILLALGIGYGTTLAIMHGQGFPVLAALITLAGVIMMGFGIVSDQISALRIDLLERGEEPHGPPRRDRE